MLKKRRSVTIQDVAQTAGVSVSTVSRVINGKVDVASETQDRILSVIHDLGYTASLAARSMRSRKKNLVGLIMPDIEFPFAVEVMKGVNRAITESEFDLLVYTTGDVHKSGRALHEQKYVALLANSIADGVIIVAPVAGEFNIDAPIVSIDPLASNPNYPAVHATNYQGAMDAMEYLLNLGHRRIAMIGGNDQTSTGRDRYQGYLNAMRNAGLEVKPHWRIPGPRTKQAGFEAASQFLALKDKPTAACCWNDLVAIGLMNGIARAGLVPGVDISVTGYDDLEEAAIATPALTTVWNGQREVT